MYKLYLLSTTNINTTPPFVIPTNKSILINYINTTPPTVISSNMPF